MTEQPPKPSGKFRVIPFVICAAACFHAAYSTPLSFFIFGYVLCLVRLAWDLAPRPAFYAGLAVGMLCFAPQLGFFWGIFHWMAPALWFIMAFWIALFVALASAAFKNLGANGGVLLAPFLWMGLEYFRSELYYLRFAWLNVGYSLAGASQYFSFHFFGVYGIGFTIVFVAGCMVAGRWKWLGAGFAGAFIVMAVLLPGGSWLHSPPRRVQVAGVQLEFPSTGEVVSNLNKAIAQHPEAQLLVLSEYTFTERVPREVLDWCREKKKYLVVGATDPVPDGNYYDTAFVVGPDGVEVFKQAKSVPIQFFSDGLPAQEQKVWESPWGKIGICICYDLSYTRVADRLIQLGARAIIVPAMDVKEWGRHEHELHGRVALVRAAEYEAPVFRVASSGMSQLVNAHGEEKAGAPFGGHGEIISGEMVIESISYFQLSRLPLPLDRFLAPLSVVVTAVFILWLPGAAFFRLALRRGKPAPPMEL